MKRLKFLLIVLVSVVSLIPVFLYKTGFFIVNEPVKSNILIVEGWMSSHAIDHPPFDYNDFDTLFVVGVKRNENWDVVEEKRQHEKKQKDNLRLITNGYVFLKGYDKKKIKSTVSRVSIVAKSSSAEGEFAHFFVSLKDSMFAHTFVTGQIDTFSFPVKLSPDQLPYLNLYFNNDRLTKTEDINLEVYKIMLDTFSFLPSRNECFYLNKDLISSAMMNAHYLSSKAGIKPKIIVVDTLFRSRNNTLASAKAFNLYLRKNNIKLNSVNIYTYPTHSRRTKLAYEKALPKNFAVGTYISPFKKNKSFHSAGETHWYLAVWDEFISWIGTAFIIRSSGQN